MGRTPELAVADAGFYSAKNVAKAEQMGVKRVLLPNRFTRSQAWRQHQKQRWLTTTASRILRLRLGPSDVPATPKPGRT